ncbi:MAG: methyltransferase domain-containing protein [Pseudomonadota bacterium]
MDSKQYFDEVAGQWDEMRNVFFPESVREKAFEVSKVESGKIAADIGAGTGFITEGLIKRGLKVFAVDQSQEMLGEINRKFNSPFIDCRIGSAEALPLDDNSVHYAFANMYLHHVESPAAAIKEMVRILKPGGKLIITDLDEHQHEYLIKEHHDRWKGFKRSDVKKWFIDAGLKDVMVDCAGDKCSCKDARSSDQISISIFIASGQK